MRAPGNLEELDAESQPAWDEAIAAVIAELRSNDWWSEFVTDDQAQIPEVRAPDWPAFPVRIATCLGWQRALELLDWRPAGEGDVGRFRHQEEYLEWRVVKERETIRRIEMTTELREYWEVLAAHHPRKMLELVAEFASEASVPCTAVYGSTDPFGAGVDAKARAEAFARTMLPSPAGDDDGRDVLQGVSPYNNGLKAICCLIHRFNRLLDLIRLVSTSAHPLLVRDPVTERIRFPSGSEAIAGLQPRPPVALDGRNSDPLIVERVVRFATEGRRIGFDDPLGIYIRDFQHHELALPDGKPLPAAWFEPEGAREAIRFGRGVGPKQAADGRPRYQRLVLELPDDAGMLLGDLIVRRTGERIRFGGQLAALTQLGVYVRTSPGQEDVAHSPRSPVTGGVDCAGIASSWREARGGTVNPWRQVPEQLQEGIYLRPSVPAPAAWRVLLLDIDSQTPRPDATAAVAELYSMLTELKAGVVRELLTDDSRANVAALAPANSFTVLIGYGASFWNDAHRPQLTAAQRPPHLVMLRQDGPAFPGLPWAKDPGERERGEADLLLQFTGVSEQAVDRAAVEVWKLIEDQRLPLSVIASYDGFQRDDARSWIGFHDGINNIEPSQRPAAVVCTGDPDWNRGGTYLALLRIEVDLRPWRVRSKTEQEVLVGRDKVTGWPLDAASFEDGRLQLRPVSEEPIRDDADWLTRDRWVNPPETADSVLENSHVHRANQNRAAGTTSAGERVFRQGYEYLEDFVDGAPRLGLNFVSYQNDLFHLQQVLGLGSWLGAVNFGGREAKLREPQAPSFLSLRAGGFYAVPPRQHPFPGARLLAS